MSNSYVGVAGMGMPRIRPRGANAPAGLLAVILIGLGVLSLLQGAWNDMPLLYWLAGLLIVLGVLTPMSLKMANQWERAVVLRLGKLQAVRGPGMFVIIPFIDDVSSWLDKSNQTTEVNAEHVLIL